MMNPCVRDPRRGASHPYMRTERLQRYADDAEEPSRFECQLCRMIRLLISTRDWKRPDGAES